jgi:anti-sigma regulatory factor (Ser/Thr protein kinase)
MQRHRAEEARIRILVERSGIFAFERFIARLPFVKPTELNRIKLAGDEIFDNLLRHAAPLMGGTATVRVARRGRDLYLQFFFKSSSFAAYAARVRDHEPIFDHQARRWHGMGLRMTRNLTSSLRFRAGDHCDRIIIRF